MEWLLNLENAIVEYKWVWLTILAVIVAVAMVKKLLNKSVNHHAGQIDYNPQHEDYYDEIRRRMRASDDEVGSRLRASIDEVFRRYR